jgi:hypothetical protein
LTARPRARPARRPITAMPGSSATAPIWLQASGWAMTMAVRWMNRSPVAAFPPRFGVTSCCMPTKTSRSGRLARPHLRAPKRSARTTAGAISPPVTVRATRSSKAPKVSLRNYRRSSGRLFSFNRSLSAAPSHPIRHSRLRGNPLWLQHYMNCKAALFSVWNEIVDQL